MNTQKIPASVELPSNAVVVISPRAFAPVYRFVKRSPQSKPTVLLTGERAGFHGIFRMPTR